MISGSKDNLDKVTKEWDDEVNDETARLIKSGTPPYEAAIKAAKNVSDRRRYSSDGKGAEFINFGKPKSDE